MEKQPPRKYVSFSSHGGEGRRTRVVSPRLSLDAIDERFEEPQQTGNGDEEEVSGSELDSTKAGVFEDVDLFLQSLSDSDVESLEIPRSVELLSEMVDSAINKYNETPSVSMFGRNPDQDNSFFEAIDRVSAISNKLAQFPSKSKTWPSLDRTSAVLQTAMAFLEETLRLLLEQSQTTDPDRKATKTSKQSSFRSDNETSDHCELPGIGSGVEEYPAISDEIVSTINRISRTMFLAKYDHEFCFTYCVQRRSAFKTALNDLGFAIISIDDVQKTPCESLEAQIATWVNCVEKCRDFLFSAERQLAVSVFSDQLSFSHTIFGEIARAVVLRLLNFADGVALTKRSAEKLFKFLDMYEALRDLIPTIKEFPEDFVDELVEETERVKALIGEAAVSIFCNLENSIKSDNGRIPVASGAVHPLTRYVMNYLKYACEYKNTFEQVFDEQSAIEGKVSSCFGEQLTTVMELLDNNLEMKSKLYRDPSLRYIFLMNNGRYILQKIKGTTEIRELMGDAWCRKRSSSLRHYHKIYQRETWGKILQCLSHEGLQINGKICKPVLKERFKSFNAMFDEIHRTQSTWVVSDEQLQSELRVSISAVMIPAYRSFLGRFKQYLDSGRQSEKYIKFQPEDIENLIEEFFDGNALTMARRRP